MKKRWIALLLIFTLAFVFIGCNGNGGGDDDDSIKPVSVEIKGPDIENNEITLEMNEEVELTAEVTPSGASQDIIWASSNNDVATVDEGIVAAVGEGSATIYAKAKSRQSIFAEITVVVQAPLADPDSVSITGPDQVSLGSFITLFAVVEPENASQAVIWESSDETIATVSNGSVTGVELGNVTITVKVVADESIYAEKEITVVEQSSDGPSSVKIRGENELIVGGSIFLEATVLPAGASQKVEWSSQNTNIAVVSQTGEVTALKEGFVWIVATAEGHPNIMDMIQITVKPEPAQIEFPDLQGYEIIIMAAPHALNEHDPFLEDYIGDDTTEKQRAWRDVEGLMNCTMKVVAYPDTAPWGQPRIDWLNQQASTNEAETDIFVSTTEWLAELVEGGAALDVLEYYQRYGQSSMSPGLKGASTYQGGLYSLIYPPIDGLNVDKGLFYNVNLIDELDLDSPASKFNNDEWTFDDFETYVTEANSRLVEGQTVLSGRPALYYMGMVNSSGIPLADIISGLTNFNHPIAIETANLLRKIYNEIGWGDIAWDAGAESFNSGDSIFQSGDYWFLKYPDRWKEDLWGEGTTKFGYVPYPYANNKSKEEAKTSGIGGACYMQANGRQYPAHVNEEYINLAFTEMMLRTAKYIKEDVTYDPIQKKRNAANNKLDDPESVEAVIFFTKDKVVFDPLYELGGGTIRFTISGAIDAVVVDGEDYAAEMSAIENEVLQAMFDVYK